MRGVNKVIALGNVGKDPEMRFTPSGDPTTSFSVAVSEKYGEKESTTWFNIVTWKKLAEVCNQYLAKGQPVYVEGKLKNSSWQSPDGQKHYKTEVIAERVIFLGRKELGESKDEDEYDDEGATDEIPF